PVDIIEIGFSGVIGSVERGLPFGLVPTVDTVYAKYEGDLVAWTRHVLLLERKAELGHEVMRTIAIRKLGPRTDEDVEMTCRVVSPHCDRIVVREPFDSRIDIMCQAHEERVIGDYCNGAPRQDDLQPAYPIG